MSRESTERLVRIAQETLRDPAASEREKSLAGSVLSQADTTDKLVELVAGHTEAGTAPTKEELDALGLHSLSGSYRGEG